MYKSAQKNRIYQDYTYIEVQTFMDGFLIPSKREDFEGRININLIRIFEIQILKTEKNGMRYE